MFPARGRRFGDSRDKMLPEWGQDSPCWTSYDSRLQSRGGSLQRGGR